MKTSSSNETLSLTDERNSVQDKKSINEIILLIDILQHLYLFLALHPFARSAKFGKSHSKYKFSIKIDHG